VSNSIAHTVIHSGIIKESRAQFIICRLDNLDVGFVNIYAPNRGNERAELWDIFSSQLPPASSWTILGDFNMVEL